MPAKDEANELRISPTNWTMTMRQHWCLFILSLCILAVASRSALGANPADLVLTGGKIVTLDAQGDDWIKAGPLKITIDGGIHWGTTRLSEAYGPKRIAFYRLTDPDTLAQVYGPEWASRFIGLGDWVRGGVPVAVNSDHMIGLDPNHAMNSFNPLLMLSIAVTRKTLDGNVHGSQQALSRVDALRTVTQWPARLSFDEAKLGTLEVGKLADLVVLDHDFLTCPDSEIAGLTVAQTIVAGRTVFRK